MKMTIGCIGVGGVFYHGLVRMATYCNKRGEGTKVVLVDPDVIEGKNAVRQWGIGIGEAKVTVAAKALDTLTGAIVYPHVGKVDEHTNLLAYMYAERTDGADTILVVSLPDNHRTRVRAHKECDMLSQMTGKPVMEVTAGNEVDNGYAYGCVHLPKKCMGRWIKGHRDILEEAKREEMELARPMPCGNLPRPFGVEQTGEGNFFTAGCVWDLVEWMTASRGFGEYLWSVVEGKVRVRSILYTANGRKA
jgi:hypothetical protein